MANIALPGTAVADRALLACVLCASTGLSKHGVGVEPLFGTMAMPAQGGGVPTMDLSFLALCSKPRNPRNPSLASLPLLSTVCSPSDGCSTYTVPVS